MMVFNSVNRKQKPMVTSWDKNVYSYGMLGKTKKTSYVILLRLFYFSFCSTNPYKHCIIVINAQSEQWKKKRP